MTTELDSSWQWNLQNGHSSTNNNVNSKSFERAIMVTWKNTSKTQTSLYLGLIVKPVYFKGSILGNYSLQIGHAHATTQVLSTLEMLVCYNGFTVYCMKHLGGKWCHCRRLYQPRPFVSLTFKNSGLLSVRLSVILPYKSLVNPVVSLGKLDTL